MTAQQQAWNVSNLPSTNPAAEVPRSSAPEYDQSSDNLLPYDLD